MTLSQIEKRLEALEQKVEALKSPAVRNGKWWVQRAGTFANNPVYEEIIRRGQAYRKSLRPKTRNRVR